MAVQSLKCPCLLNGRFSHPLKWQTSSVWAKTMLYVQVRGSTSGAQIKLTHSKWHESMCLSLLTHDQYELMRWQEPTLLWWWGSECVERSRMLNARRGRGVNKKTRTIHPSTSKHPLTCSSLVDTHTHTLLSQHGVVIAVQSTHRVFSGPAVQWSGVWIWAFNLR